MGCSRIRCAADGALRRCRSLVSRLEPAAARFAARSDMLSSLFYAVCSGAFRREHRGVLHGRVAHVEGRCADSLAYRLRRNVHRLEKGLTMRPRRAVFGVRYLGETLDGYAALQRAGAAQGGALDACEWSWIDDVLTLYFSVAGPHPEIDRQRRRFRGLNPGLRKDGAVLETPARGEVPADRPVRLVDYLALVRRRRSVRWFAPRPVPRDVLDRAVEAASQSPSACNRQPYRFVILDRPEDVRRVSAIPMGTVGYSHNIPVLAIAVGQWRAFFSERDRHVIYIDAALAAMSFVLALETQGVGTCCVNWPDIADKEREMAATLGLAADERVVLLIAAGYADPEGRVARSGKKTVGRLRSYGLP